MVLDTNAVLSGLLFSRGRLAWLRGAWAAGHILPLVCSATVRELIRALTYPKFELTQHDVQVCLAAYLPFTDSVDLTAGTIDVPVCRDPQDQVFLQLAAVGEAEVLRSHPRGLSEQFGNTMAHLIVVQLTTDAWALAGLVSGQPEFAKNRADVQHVILIGGAHQVWIPNLTLRDVHELRTVS